MQFEFVNFNFLLILSLLFYNFIFDLSKSNIFLINCKKLFNFYKFFYILFMNVIQDIFKPGLIRQNIEISVFCKKIMGISSTKICTFNHR